MFILAIFLMVFSSILLIASQTMPLFLARFHRLQEKKVNAAEKKLDVMFIQVKREKLFLFYTLTPLLLGAGAFLFFKNLPFVLIGVAIGFLLPTLAIRYLQVQRKSRFAAQLVDAIMVISSALKGGLSLLQAIEVLVEEMPAPISEEFGLIIRENKMGVPLEESFKHLSERMQTEELQLVINSILVARETGGDLTKVLSRLCTTIRDNYKLKDSVKTLTTQGKLQGLIMSILPFIFVFWVSAFNRSHFDIMLESETGRMLLVAAVILQLVGMVLIKKFSTIKI